MTVVNRRRALKLFGTGALAAATGPWLVGCATGAGPQNVSNSGRELAPWPTYVPAAGPKPDLTSALPAGLDAYFRYPDAPTRSVAAVPGDGSTVKVGTITFGPPPAPVGSNKLWTAINQAMGVDLQLALTPNTDYSNKFATIMAGGDLPDVLYCTGGPRVQEFIAASCADLSEYLSGDNIKQYPNLANIPTHSWQGIGRIGGRLYSVPISRGQLGQLIYVNRSALDDLGIPKDDWTQEQFLSSMQQMKERKIYGIGAYEAEWMVKKIFGAALGAPNSWSEKDGTFTTAYSAPEYRDAILLARDAYKRGCYAPNAAEASVTDVMNDFYIGKVGSVSQALPSFGQGIYQSRIGDAFELDVMGPFGTAPGLWNVPGNSGYMVLKKAEPERIKMLLRLLDYAAAPYGTVENELLNYGVEGVHFERGDGKLDMLPLADTENITSLPIGKYLCDAPDVFQVPGSEADTRRAFELQEKYLPMGIADPAVGLSSASKDKLLPGLDKSMTDALTPIVTGRADITAWDEAVKNFKSNGGDTIAGELATEFAAAAG